MADQYSKMYDVERIGGDQRQRLAEMLRANALNVPQGQMVGNWYVKPSWTQNLAHLAQTATGVFGGIAAEEDKNKQIAELMRQRKEGVAIETPPLQTVFNNIEQIKPEGQSQNQQMPPVQNSLQRFTQTPQVSPEQTNIQQATQLSQPQPKFRPMTQAELDENTMAMYNIDPRRAALMTSMEANRVAREEAKALKEEQRAWQSRENQLNRENQQLGWAMARGNKPERMLTVMDESGNPFTIPQSQLQPGMTLYTPTSAKAFKEKQSQVEGKQNFTNTIDDLRKQYGILNKNMAIPSEQNRWGSNLGAKLSSTGVGQWLGQVGGTQSATARDVIRMSRPALMQSIVKASGMSAKQIDSNAEMKLMLDMATDPTAGYEANMQALDNLQNRFAPQQQSASNW